MIVILVASNILDGGGILRCVAYAAAAWWIGVLIVLIRRRDNLLPPDWLLFRWGYLILCAISIPLTLGIWHLRGLMCRVRRGRFVANVGVDGSQDADDRHQPENGGHHEKPGEMTEIIGRHVHGQYPETEE